jgi:hypothetical protein
MQKINTPSTIESGDRPYLSVLLKDIGNVILLQVVEQRGFEHARDYGTSCGIVISSEDFPDWNHKVLYVQGSVKDRDNDVVTIPKSDVSLDTLVAAIHELNGISGTDIVLKLRPADIHMDLFDVDGDKMYLYQVEQQTAREFRPFEASNGIIIASIIHPQFNEKTKTLYVRGTSLNSDNEIIAIPTDDVDAVFKALEEFNTYRNVENGGVMILKGKLDLRDISRE